MCACIFALSYLQNIPFFLDKGASMLPLGLHCQRESKKEGRRERERESGRESVR